MSVLPLSAAKCRGVDMGAASSATSYDSAVVAALTAIDRSEDNRSCGKTAGDPRWGSSWPAGNTRKKA